VFTSAGLDRQPIDPRTISFLGERGMDISHHASKSIDQVPYFDHYQVMVSLAKAAQRVFPPPPTKAVCLDWSISDPSVVQGTPEQVQAAYAETFEFLQAHVNDLVEAVLGDG